MRRQVAKVLRRLVPLVLLASNGCGADPNSSDASCHPAVDEVIDVARPSQDPDGGVGPTVEDWDACAQSAQCSALCWEVAPRPSANPLSFASCMATVNASADAGGGQTLHLHVVASYNTCLNGA